MKCAVLVGLAALSALAFCQDASGMPQAGTISLKAQDRDVRDVLRDLFKQAQKSYTLSPAVAGKVTAVLDKTTLEFALPKVLDQVNATYRIDGGVYAVFPWVSLADGPRLDSRGVVVGYHVSDASPLDAFNALPKTKPIVVEPGVVGVVSLTSSGLSYRDTLDKIARQADAKVVETDAEYRIVPLESLHRPLPQLQRQDADLRAVVTELLRSTGVSFIVSNGVAGRVTVDLKDTDVATALDVLLQPIGGKVTLRRGVYIVSAK